MARIRTIKPEFWTDSKTGTLSGLATKLFLGLLNHSDDYGVIEFNPLEYKGKIFPYETGDIALVVLAPLLDELLPKGLVQIFEYSPFTECSVNGHGTFTEHSPVVSERSKQFLHITNFAKHQRVNRPGEPLITGWGNGDTIASFAQKVEVGGHGKVRLGRLNANREISFTECSVNGHGTFTEHSRWKGKERKGKERKGKEGKGGEENVAPANADAPPETPTAKTKKAKNKTDTPKHEIEKLSVPVWLNDLWPLWEQARRQIRKPLTPLAVAGQLKSLELWAEKYGQDAARHALQMSINSGWQGIFERHAQEYTLKNSGTNGGLLSRADEKLAQNAARIASALAGTMERT